MAIAKDGAPLRAIDDITGIRIEFNSALDTINYTEGDFPLSWNTTGYEGKFLFQLFSSKDGRLIYKDSVSDNMVMISKFSKLMRPGRSYRWLIGTRGMSIRRPRVINCVPPIKLKEFIDNIDSLDVPEDPAAVYFRIGFMLEKERYYAQVLDYYIKAVMLDEGTSLYLDRLTTFCKEFRIELPDLGD